MAPDILRDLPTVVCPGCGQFHQVDQLRRCGCGWTGIALPTPPGELPLVIARSLERRRPGDHEPDQLARWRFLATDAGLDYVAGAFAGNCGVCKNPPRSSSALALRVTLAAPIGDELARELTICAFCILRIAHDLVGGPI
jgi:hypothetical protein